MIRRLAALYPKSWRARHGAEFDALLAEQRLTPSVLLDLLLGALDAHLAGDNGVSSVVSKWRTPAALSLTFGGFLWFAGWVIWTLPWVTVSPNLSDAWPLILCVSILGVVSGELLVAFGILGFALATRRTLLLAVGSLVALGLLFDGARVIVLLLRRYELMGFEPLWLCIGIAGVAALVAQPVFAAIAAIRGVLPWPPLAVLATVSFANLVMNYLAAPLLPTWVFFQLNSVAHFLTPLCWLLVGVAFLVSRPTRMEIARV